MAKKKKTGGPFFIAAIAIILLVGVFVLLVITQREDKVSVSRPSVVQSEVETEEVDVPPIDPTISSIVETTLEVTNAEVKGSDTEPRVHVSFKLDNNTGRTITYSEDDFAYTDSSNNRIYQPLSDEPGFDIFTAATLEDAGSIEGLLVFAPAEAEEGTLTWSPPNSEESTAYKLTFR